MTKNDFVHKVAERSDLSVSKAGVAVNAVIEIISEALSAGDFVRLNGLCTFDTIMRKSHNFMNMHTGEVDTAPAVIKPRCRFAKQIKNEVANNNG